MADAFYPFVGEGPADIPGLATPAAGQQGNAADSQPTPAPSAAATLAEPVAMRAAMPENSPA
ncbi:hypothetical protein, partial [uncultured Parolsenella sp.]|uniref:hypothetical protein n=1 Tax=uncultured Parolsenella sp. TaxID=2083008 RepID=UPI0027DE490F